MAFSYEDIINAPGEVNLVGVDGALGARELLSEIQSFQEPAMSRVRNPFPTGFGTPEIMGRVNPLITSFVSRSQVPEMGIYFRPRLGAGATGILPWLEVVELMQTDRAVGVDYSLLVHEIHGRLAGRTPGPTGVDQIKQRTFEIATEKFVSYVVDLRYTDTGTLERDPDTSQSNAAPTVTDGVASYADPTKAPATYYHPVLGHWFENGVDIWAGERALLSVSDLVRPSGG